MICSIEQSRIMKRTIKEYNSVALRSDDLNGLIDFDRLFGRKAPVHIEIGSGKGTFLLHESQASSDIDFLGIEWARKYYLYAVDRIARWGVSNVRIIRTDAVTFLTDHIRDTSIMCFHIYFPDPWPKKRHNKRRFVQRDNVRTLIRCLGPGGELRLATDHADYFRQMQEVTLEFRNELEEIEFIRPAGAEEGELTGTNFERKYIRDKRTIRTLALRKR